MNQHNDQQTILDTQVNTINCKNNFTFRYFKIHLYVVLQLCYAVINVFDNVNKVISLLKEGAGANSHRIREGRLARHFCITYFYILMEVNF